MKPRLSGTHPRVLGESYPMNTNMIGLRWFSEIFASLVLLTKVAFAVQEELTLPLLSLLSYKHKDVIFFWKPSKPCHIGIH